MHRARSARIATIALLTALTTACANKSLPGTGTRAAVTMGTISGLVSTGDGSTPVSGRKVTAINTATNARVDTSTATNGGYTMRVPEGHYRLEVELRAGERLDKRPDPTTVGSGDLDAERNFVIAR
ncbi:MAG TPA: carboxypeptidase-like regulatory domain-containing protein [Vicinamibacterales bacterium]|jgi:hypothetical protein|nr:carboxypeptidase-like regulatory domain-containing protein [Vicinamibacterales bacterium]